MKVFYTSEGEQSGAMTLNSLISNFNENGGWKFRHNEKDMRDELNSRGWYEGSHEFGHYLVINLERLPLEYRDPAMDA